MARRARVGICTYCGSEREVTEDHIIPQCLWTGRVPKKVPKVPACRQCNHILKSVLDAYLRDLLITDRHAAMSPIAQELHAKYIRSVLTNKSRMDRDYRERGTVIAKVSPSGLFAGYGLISRAVNERTEQILTMMVRGLHQYYLDVSLPPDTSFTIIRLFEKEHFEEVSQMIDLLDGGYEMIGNGDVFSCAYASASRIGFPHIGFWELVFYRRVAFAVMTRLPLARLPE